MGRSRRDELAGLLGTLAICLRCGLGWDGMGWDQDNVCTGGRMRARGPSYSCICIFVLRVRGSKLGFFFFTARTGMPVGWLVGLRLDLDLG
ncbi:hypothetical protein F4774DRAFT_56907 [Daldinia eschscholtzii]|nr:hypothetical protein F4774DRAFT_56907 [Daldinia eschscholtzii]